MFEALGAIVALGATVGLFAHTLSKDRLVVLAIVGVGCLFVDIGRKGREEHHRERRIDTARRVVILRDDSPLPFKDILALQILRKKCHGENRDYYSYELNVVKRNFNRSNIVDHGDESSIENDAHLLAEALSCPIVRD